MDRRIARLFVGTVRVTAMVGSASMRVRKQSAQAIYTLRRENQKFSSPLLQGDTREDISRYHLTLPLSGAVCGLL